MILLLMVLMVWVVALAAVAHRFGARRARGLYRSFPTGDRESP